MARKTIKLDEFKGIKIELDIEETIRKHCEEATEELQNFNNWKWRRKNGETYSKGWTYKIDDKYKQNVVGYVYNKTSWQLTWLLENGHLIVNKRNGVGWAAPKKHIEPTYDRQSKKFINDMENIHLDIDFE